MVVVGEVSTGSRATGSEILYLLDSAQGLFTPQGNTSRRVSASCAKSPGVGARFALHITSTRQPVRP